MYVFMCVCMYVYIYTCVCMMRPTPRVQSTHIVARHVEPLCLESRHCFWVDDLYQWVACMLTMSTWSLDSDCELSPQALSHTYQRSRTACLCFHLLKPRTRSAYVEVILNVVVKHLWGCIARLRICHQNVGNYSGPYSRQPQGHRFNLTFRSFSFLGGVLQCSGLIQQYTAFLGTPECQSLWMHVGATRGRHLWSQQ